jgi:hypothetical protein
MIRIWREFANGTDQLKPKAQPSMTQNWIPETFFRASSSGPRLTNGFKGHEETVPDYIYVHTHTIPLFTHMYMTLETRFY